MNDREPHPDYQWPKLPGETVWQWNRRVTNIKKETPSLNEYMFAGFYGFVICGVLGSHHDAMKNTRQWCDDAGLIKYEDWMIPAREVCWGPSVVWFSTPDAALQFSLAHEAMEKPEFYDYLLRSKSCDIL